MELQMWREILEPYELAVQELTIKFEHIRQEFQDRSGYSPIEDVEGRIKKISSILEKCQKKHISYDEIEEKIEDIAGIRIICQFVEDIDRVVMLIRNRNDMEVVEEKDYVNQAKESGYRSYHVVIMYTVNVLDGPKKLQAEIQIRTMAMNFWATIEHSLQYKYKKNIPGEIKDRLLKAADATVALDKEMSQVRLEIMDAQNIFHKQAKVVADILNTIQNMYKVANPGEMVKIQDEFYQVYSQNNLEQLERFFKQLDNIAQGYRAQSLK